MDEIADVQRYIPPEISVPGIPEGTFSFPDVGVAPGDATGLEQVTFDFGVPGVEPLRFDFPGEMRRAYDSLKPFYDKLLQFAGGDMDLAKRILEYSYQQGMREATQEHEQQVGQQNLIFPEETAELQTTQNRRGIYESGFGRTERERLQESQNIRRQAVDRALQNRQSRLTSERGFGGEQTQRDFTRERFGLERERRQEAGDITQRRYDIKSGQYQAQLGKAQQEEQRRIRQEQNQATQDLFGGGGGSSGPLRNPNPGQPYTVDGGRLYGGWYENPETGRVERYWGNNYWTSGADPFA